ncbi:MAG: ParA family protein [Pyrinomonadaceae bacterium]
MSKSDGGKEMFVISVSNQKGGVGKTSSASSCSAELAIRGYRTLVIDGDPQANLTSNLLPPAPEPFKHTLLDLIAGDAQVRIIDAAVKTEVERLSIIPTNLGLAKFEQEPSDSIHVLREKLLEVEDLFDFVIIDNPPSLSQLLISSLTASTHVIIPISAQPMAQEGLQDLLSTYKRVTSRSNKDLALLGMVITLFDARTGVNATMLKSIRSKFGDLVFDTIIHRNVKLEECPAVHQPIQVYSPDSRGAQNYSALTDEFLTRLGMPARKDGAGVDEEVEVEPLMAAGGAGSKEV